MARSGPVTAQRRSPAERSAWMLATNPNASVRNGAEAVELAQRAVELSGGREPAILDTLAAAYAEAGRFPEAVKTAQRAAALASARGDTRWPIPSARGSSSTRPAPRIAKHALSTANELAKKTFMSRRPKKSQPLDHRAPGRRRANVSLAATESRPCTRAILCYGGIAPGQGLSGGTVWMLAVCGFLVLAVASGLWADGPARVRQL